MTDYKKLLNEFPEINPANYGDDEVNALNAWGIAAHTAIEALAAENERLKDQIDCFVNGQSQLFEVARILEEDRDALQAKLDELGKGEPVTDSYVQTVPDKCNRIVWRDKYYHLPIAAPKALAPLTDEQMRDAFAQALTDVYVCTRVWSAWSYGTMTEDDFSPASECDEVLDSLVQAAHGIGGTP